MTDHLLYSVAAPHTWVSLLGTPLLVDSSPGGPPPCVSAPLAPRYHVCLIWRLLFVHHSSGSERAVRVVRVTPRDYHACNSLVPLAPRTATMAGGNRM